MGVLLYMSECSQFRKQFPEGDKGGATREQCGIVGAAHFPANFDFELLEEEQGKPPPRRNPKEVY